MKEMKSINDKWSKKIILDIGEDAYRKLFYSSDENIKISPHYSFNENRLIHPEKLLFPSNWNIIGDIDCNKTKDLNKEIKKLYKNDITNLILYNYKSHYLDKSVTSLGNIFISTNEITKQSSGATILIEPKLEKLEKLSLNDLVDEKFKINISSEFFKISGANIVQEIAFTLSAAAELVDKFGSGLLEKISFEVIQGSNYFFEIAKIQVLRVLWSIISNKYGNQIDDCIITAKPTVKNKTIENFNNNIIRSTTECMSGILGGCNYIKSISYDLKFKDRNDFSERIKYNQLLIIKNETSISRVNNAVSGSYYLTYLIENLAQKSLDLFKKIISDGGYTSSLKNGGLFSQILSNSEKVKEQYNSGEKILVGFNKYIND